MIDIKFIQKTLNNISSVIAVLHENEAEFTIWPQEELEEWNKDYNVQQYLPGFIAIGSDGGLEMLTVELSTGLVYAIPFIPMDSNEKIKVADSLIKLVNSKNTKR